MVPTLAVIESKNIAAGVLIADSMVKASEVELLKSAPVCSGRHLIIVSGDEGAVAAAVEAAKNTAYSLSGCFILSNVSPQISQVLKGSLSATEGQAVGVVECRNVSSGIAAADQAVKRAAVKLLRLVSGQGIMGKSYFVLEGDVGSVTEALDCAKAFLGHQLIEAIIMPAPAESVVKALTGRLR